MAAPSDNVWIGDLPVGMEKDKLTTIFEAYGQISDCKVIPARDENSKCSAMVRFASMDMATWVVQNLNGNIPEGLDEPIITRYANADRAKGSAPKGAAWGGVVVSPYGKGGVAKGGFVAPAPNDNVWVGDLPLGTDKPDLAGIFEAYGQVVDCRMLPGRDATSKPAAMVRFATVAMATWVVENLNGNIPEKLNEPITVRFANAGGAKGGAKGAGDSWGAMGGGGCWGKAAGYGGGKDGGWDGGMDYGKGKDGGKGVSAKGLFQTAKGSGILGGGTVPDECQCHVSNLPLDMTDFDLYKLFSPFGAIPPNGVKAMTNPDGSCKGVGFVDFADPAAAATAVASLNGMDGMGVSTKMPSKKGGAKGKW